VGAVQAVHRPPGGAHCSDYVADRFGLRPGIRLTTTATSVVYDEPSGT
jgi:hypothetical protein